MEPIEFWLLREISLDDVPLVCCLPSELRAIKRLVDGGLVELQGRWLKRAVITGRGLNLLAD